jgi:hypothetical protein
MITNTNRRRRGLERSPDGTRGLAMIATSRRIGLGEGFGDWLVHFTNNALRMTNTNPRRRRGLTRPEGTRGLAMIATSRRRAWRLAGAFHE